MNSNNAPVQLIENLFKQYKKNNILVALQNKSSSTAVGTESWHNCIPIPGVSTSNLSHHHQTETNTNVKVFRTIKAHHIHSKYSPS